MSTTEVAKPVNSTYGWLANTPLASSAGTAVYSWYESSKNYCRVSKFALGTMESSAYYVAGAAAPIVHRLDSPLRAVDSLALKGLEILEEKVPTIKKEPGEVMELLTERKDELLTHLCDGKQAVYDRLYTGKEAITTRITSTLVSGKDAVYTRLESGADALTNSRVGWIVGSGMDCTLSHTESLVDYLLPPEPNEKELLLEDEKPESSEEEEASGDEEEQKEEESEGKTADKGKKRWRWRWRRRRGGKKGKKVNEEEEEEGEVEEEAEEKEEDDKGSGVAMYVSPTRYVRVKTLSRKVKLRLYYRSLRALQTVQRQCKATLDQLKLSVDVLKIAQSARASVGHQYDRAQERLRSLESQLRSMLSLQEKVTGEALPEHSGDESDDDIQWLPPHEEEEAKTFLQSTLDYAKQLSERVYGALQSVVKATTYLPHHLKIGAIQAYTQAHDLYTSLKGVSVPTDLPASTLNRISAVIETQRNYLHDLGEYLSTALRGKAGSRTPEEAKSITSPPEGGGSGSEEEEEEEEEDPSVDPAASRQPQPREETSV